MKTIFFLILLTRSVTYGAPVIENDVIENENIDTEYNSLNFLPFPEKNEIIDKEINHKHQVVSGLSLKKTTNNKPRCGVPDMKQAAIGLQNRMGDDRGEQWTKHDLTWFFDSKNGRYVYDSSNIRRTIREAFKVWSQRSVLTFQEVSSPDSADIVLSFEQPFHPDVDPYDMPDGVLAHAFGPGSGLGGDVHFNYQVEWDLGVLFGQQPASESATSLFAVALHEIGHSFGLSHSTNPKAVMYDSYTENTGILSNEDVERIQGIYGVPDGFNKEDDVTQEIYFTDPPTTTTDIPLTTHQTNVPDRCNMRYDAITLIHGELFIFKDTYMWRPQLNGDRLSIRDIWWDLPTDFSYVDAVFQDEKGRILFFIGRNIYVFKKNIFAYQTTLSTRYGIEHSVSKIDTIFKWHYNKRTYIFSGDKFWRLDGDVVAENYPKDIHRRWANVNNFDTSFSNDSHLYFFRNQYFYEFSYHTMSLDRHSYQLASHVFMHCSHISNLVVNYEMPDNSFAVQQEQPNSGSLSYLLLYVVLSTLLY